MKRKIGLLLTFISLCHFTNAQIKSDDFGRIILNTWLPAQINLPSEARKLLETKLSQITTGNGIGGSQCNPRFIITAAINIGTKDIIPGPPQLIAQNLELTLFVGDAITNTVFVNTILNLKGVGTNENKAFIEAFKMINPKNKEIGTFLEEGKNKIIAYYSEQCDFIIKEANTKAKEEHFDEAIYNLAIVPNVCKECYFKCLEIIPVIFKKKIDAECSRKLNEAKLTWTSEQSPSGAEKVGVILSKINPQSVCFNEVTNFMHLIDSKLRADEKIRWEFIMKQYNDNINAQKEQFRIAEAKSIRDDQYKENQSARNMELNKFLINAYREVAVEYVKNQPKSINYNYIVWR